MTTHTAITSLRNATTDLGNIFAKLQDPNAALAAPDASTPSGDDPELTTELADSIGDDRNGLLKAVAALKAQVGM